MTTRTSDKKRGSQAQRTVLPAQFRADPVFWTAWLYYEQGLKQDEIAQHLGLSRASVFNLLQRARDEGIVNITIDTARMKVSDLAATLMEKTGLSECHILPTEGGDAPLSERIGRFGARIIEPHIDDDDIIGVAWGRTVLALSNGLTRASKPGVTVAQITGSSIATYAFSPELCTSNIALRLGARCVNLLAPGVVSRAEIKDLLMQEPVIRQHFELLQQCTKLLFGVTHLGSTSLLEGSGLMTEDLRKAYQERGAIGFASGYIFDADGQIITLDFDDRHIAMPFEDFRSIKQRICIGGEPEKVPAILGMLNGSLADVLITDEVTAQSVLERF